VPTRKERRWWFPGPTVWIEEAWEGGGVNLARTMPRAEEVRPRIHGIATVGLSRHGEQRCSQAGGDHLSFLPSGVVPSSSADSSTSKPTTGTTTNPWRCLDGLPRGRRAAGREEASA
jgi:hypothetical protein